MSQYRDPLAGLISQVATKRAALEDRAARLPDVVRSMLPDRLTNALDELVDRALQKADDLETLSAADAALDTLLVAYDEALALAPTLSACPSDVDPFPPPTQERPWLIEEPWLVEIREAAALRLRAIADEAPTLERWGDRAYTAQLRVDGVPLRFHCEYIVTDQSATDHRNPLLSQSVSSALRTSVPAVLPAVTIRRERAYHVVGRALGLAHEEEIGDEIFDDAFWIRGARATARLLDEGARRALLDMRGDQPVLRLGGGVAELAWGGVLGGGIADILPDEAARVVVALRHGLDPR